METKEGRAIYPKIKDDIYGHGAIKEYYPELKDKKTCIEKECTDFSKSDNFPKEIIEAIKKGKMSRIGICLDVLNETGKAEYEKIRQSALAEYEKIEQSAFSKIVSQKKYRREEWR